jgi:hypothetical protein
MRQQPISLDDDALNLLLQLAQPLELEARRFHHLFAAPAQAPVDQRPHGD